MRRHLAWALIVAWSGVGCRSHSAPPPPETRALDPIASTPQAPALAAEVYVPVYSQLMHSEGGAMELSALLSIRNTDSQHPIVVDSVRYFDGRGQLVRSEIERPGQIAPLATATFFIKKSDTRGGPGASYVVRWRSQERVTEPVVEVLMVEASLSQSLAFTSRGVVTRRSEGALPDP